MHLYVLNKELNILGIIEEITSIVWAQRKYIPGEFAMLLPMTSSKRQWKCWAVYTSRDLNGAANPLRWDGWQKKL